MGRFFPQICLLSQEDPGKKLVLGTVYNCSEARTVAKERADQDGNQSIERYGQNPKGWQPPDPSMMKSPHHGLPKPKISILSVT